MEKNEKTTETTKEIAKSRVVTLDKPYTSECKSYNKIDLSKLDDLTTDDLLKAEGLYHKSGGSSINPETTVLYSVILAHIASELPLEFFGPLPAKETMKIKKEVFNFFYR